MSATHRTAGARNFPNPLRRLLSLAAGNPAGIGRSARQDRVLALAPADLHRPAPIFIQTRAFNALRSTVGSRPAESGGILGGRRGSFTIEHFVPDESARTTTATYYPDITAVNRLLKEQWNPAGINLLGFVHSHPAGSTRPSGNDWAYLDRILAAIPEMGTMLMPIAQTIPDTGTFRVLGHTGRTSPDGTVRETCPVIVSDLRPSSGWRDHGEFDRVRDAYDLDAMGASRIVSVGCGGSAQFLEDMARAGIGEFVLIDPDTVDAPNLATQQTFRSDLGTPKVTAIARRIVDASPLARVYTVQARLEDLDDAAMGRLCRAPLDAAAPTVPRATLLCAFTDGFPSQARINRLGLHLRVPTLAATVYAQGRGVEVAFSAHGVTTACIRCALGGRYRAHLEQGYQPDVTSHGTPLWATNRLNTLKQPIALALLHHANGAGTADSPARARYATILEAIHNRNLVQVSLDPHIGQTLGLAKFTELSLADARGRLAFDTTLWLEQEPENPQTGFPACPDCGGTGSPGESEGRFRDTRPMPLTFGDHRTDTQQTAAP